MSDNDKINAAFLLIADGLKALAQPLSRCPHYWARVENRCTLPDGHDEEHVYALSEPAIWRLLEARDRERLR